MKETIQMNIFELFNLIEKRPGMYIGEKSLKLLYCFYGAFNLTKTLYNHTDKEDHIFADNFNLWVIDFYKIDNLKFLNWSNSIRIFCPNEQEGFDQFFRLLKEFKKEYNISPEGFEINPAP